MKNKNKNICKKCKVSGSYHITYYVSNHACSSFDRFYATDHTLITRIVKESNPTQIQHMEWPQKTDQHAVVTATRLHSQEEGNGQTHNENNRGNNIIVNIRYMYDNMWLTVQLWEKGPFGTFCMWCTGHVIYSMFVSIRWYKYILTMHVRRKQVGYWYDSLVYAITFLKWCLFSYLVICINIFPFIINSNENIKSALNFHFCLDYVFPTILKP